MKIFSIATLSALFFVAAIISNSDALGQDQCVSSGNHTIQVRPGPNGAPELRYRGGSAEEVHVCIGDTVRWVLNGPNRDFFVEFFSDGLFGATSRGSNGNVVEIVVGGSAQRGQGYDYNVEFTGGPGMDPRIIVD